MANNCHLGVFGMTPRCSWRWLLRNWLRRRGWNWTGSQSWRRAGDREQQKNKKETPRNILSEELAEALADLSKLLKEFENMDPIWRSSGLFLVHHLLTNITTIKKKKKKKPSNPPWTYFWKEWHLLSQSLRRVLQELLQGKAPLSQDMTEALPLKTLSGTRWGGGRGILRILMLGRPRPMCVLVS